MEGDLIKGSVSYKLLEPFPGEKLTIELFGKEKVMWEGDDKKNHDPKHPDHIVMKKTFMHETKVLKTFENFTVDKGTSSFDFTFKIPSGSPSSFFFTGVKSSRIQV